MSRALLLSAVLTGAFCVAFSLVVGALSMALTLPVVLALSFVSGALGRIFAWAVSERV